MIFNLGLLVAYVMVSLVLMAVADRRFRDHPRLPMQWGFDGRVNWTAPRRLALTATALLGGIGFLLIGVIRLTSPEVTLEETQNVNDLQIGLGILGLMIQLGYLWWVNLWAARTRSN